MDPARLETLADDLGPRLASYLEEWLEAPTLRGRLRRAGLLTSDLDER
jgi:hypothetical protein